jgi:hypothetical protein
VSNESGEAIVAAISASCVCTSAPPL